MNIKEALYAIFTKYPSWILGLIKGNAVKTHWGRSKKNFGDCLSPYILKHYGFTPIYSQTIDSDIIMAGTILQWTPKNYKGIVFGSGAGQEEINLPKATFLGVRGKLTAKNIVQQTSDDLFLGDPGLIVNKVFSKPAEKKYKIGIVPHFVDKNHEIIEKWKNSFKEGVLFIDVLRSPEDVIEDIKSCEYIFSSSLHGLITADAFDIPNVRFVIRETQPTYFYDYKFDDYYSSLEIDSKTIEVNGQEEVDLIISECRLFSAKIKKLQEILDNNLKELKNIL